MFGDRSTIGLLNTVRVSKSYVELYGFVID